MMKVELGQEIGRRKADARTVHVSLYRTMGWQRGDRTAPWRWDAATKTATLITEVPLLAAGVAVRLSGVVSPALHRGPRIQVGRNGGKSAKGRRPRVAMLTTLAAEGVDEAGLRDAFAAWLSRKILGIDGLALDRMEVEQVFVRDAGRFDAVHFEATARVVDGEALRTTLLAGVGPGKAYGFGAVAAEGPST